MNAMQYHNQGSNGAHMVPTWDDVWAACEASDAVKCYDEATREIEWVDGSKDTFANTHDALNAIAAMRGN